MSDHDEALITMSNHDEPLSTNQYQPLPIVLANHH